MNGISQIINLIIVCSMKRIIFISISCIFISTLGLFAIHPSVQNFSRTVSKSGTQNWDIIQHANNWMYFANNNGLLEFDGNKWNLYPIGNYTNVRSLHYDKTNDRIYAGAFNEFGYYERDERGILRYYSLLESISPQDRDFTEIWNILQIEDNLYFQSGKEIFRCKNGQMKKFNFIERIDCSGVAHNLLIVSTSKEGAFILNGELFIQLPNSDILKNKKICSILPYEDNKILFVSDFDGLFVFDGKAVIALKTDVDDFLKENQVFSADISGSKLAIGSVRNGLLVKDLKNNSCIYSNIYSGLQNNTILSLKYDNQDNLWLGLDKGIDYVLINSPVYDLFGNNQRYGTGYTSLIKDNILYFGTNQGLYRTNFPLKSSPQPLDIELIPGMQGQVWCLKTIDNQVFCGTDHGAFIIKKDKAEKIGEIPGTWNFRELKKHPNCILGSSYQGFFILKKEYGKWKFSNFVNGFSDSGGTFLEDEYGNIWFSHWMKGISKLTLNDKLDEVSVEAFDTSKGFYTNRNNVVSKINDEVFFSSDGGFFKFAPDENKVIHAKEIEKLFGIHPYSKHLDQDPQNNIWHISGEAVETAYLQEDGTYKVQKSSSPILSNKLIPGFKNLNFVYDSAIIINTENGFSWLDVSKIMANQETAFKVSIRNVYLTKEGYLAVGGYQDEQKEIPEFKYQHNSIRFEFVAPEYSGENTVVYSCFLENYDLDWSPYSTSNTKEYTKLPKGNYMFQIRANNSITNEIVETNYKFTILPPWYESLLAMIIYIILIACLLFLIVVFIDKRSQKGAREMKAQKEREMQEQEERFSADAQEKEKEIVKLKNQKLQYELRHKSQDLASSTMNLIRKNEILLDISQNLGKIATDLKNSDERSSILKCLIKMQDDIKKNIERDDNWKKFEANFDMVYENYLKRLGEQFSALTVSDKKLCAYLKMGLSSKDIAPLLNMSFRSVEMSRYRLRKKLDLNRDVNLTEFLQNF